MGYCLMTQAGLLRHPDELKVVLIVKAPRAVLSADAAPLDSPAGVFGGEGCVGVDPGHPAL